MQGTSHDRAALNSLVRKQRATTLNKQHQAPGYPPFVSRGSGGRFGPLKSLEYQNRFCLHPTLFNFIHGDLRFLKRKVWKFVKGEKPKSSDKNQTFTDRTCSVAVSDHKMIFEQPFHPKNKFESEQSNHMIQRLPQYPMLSMITYARYFLQTTLN